MWDAESDPKRQLYYSALITMQPHIQQQSVAGAEDVRAPERTFQPAANNSVELNKVVEDRSAI